eukprot:jgi/Chrzof1/7260/Cz02g16250.t1
MAQQVQRAVLFTVVALLSCSCCAIAQTVNVNGPGCGRQRPAKPSFISVNPSPTSLQVNWGQPSNGACIDGYGIQVFNAVLNNKVYDSGVVPSIRNAKVNGLRPLTFYRIEVTAQSRAYGNSDKAVAVATTPFGLDFNIKPSAVVDLKGYKKRAGVVNLTWKSPANFAGVDSYDVNIQPLSPQPRSFTALKNLLLKTTTIDIAQLTPGSKYRFTVTAVNGKGRGPSRSVDVFA